MFYITNIKPIYRISIQVYLAQFSPKLLALIYFVSNIHCS